MTSAIKPEIVSRVAKSRAQTNTRGASLSLQALIGLALISSGCQPAHVLDLEDTSGRVTSRGNIEEPAPQATITFLRSDVEITLACGTIVSNLVMDTDGSAIGLIGNRDVEAACDGEASGRDFDVLLALLQVESWRIETENRIVLEGGPNLVLDRVE